MSKSKHKTRQSLFFFGYHITVSYLLVLGKEYLILDT